LYNPLVQRSGKAYGKAVFTLYNRPRYTQRVLSALRAADPQYGMSEKKHLNLQALRAVAALLVLLSHS
jgi:hypothetical protein